MNSTTQRTDMDVYWNGAGGDKWVNNLTHLESVIAPAGKHLLNSLPLAQTTSVLDIGCGGGLVASKVAELIKGKGKVLGADISSTILEESTKLYGTISNLEFQVCDAETYVFEPSSYDLVISRFGIMFFVDPYAAFRNIHSAVKPGGFLRMACWQPAKKNPWMMKASAAAFEVLERPPAPQPGEPGPFSLGEEPLVIDILKKAGFRNITMQPIVEILNMGSLEAALSLMTQLGPAAKPLSEASAADKVEALRLMKAALSEDLTPQGVELSGAFWLVGAEA